MEGKCSDIAVLIRHVAAGDEASFRILYNRYFPKVKAFAYRILHDHEAALEIAQEVMLEVWQMEYRLNTILNFDAFMSTLAKRRTIDLWRRMQLKEAAEREARLAWKPYSDETTEVISLNETKQIIEEAIKLLPPQQRYDLAGLGLYWA